MPTPYVELSKYTPAVERDITGQLAGDSTITFMNIFRMLAVTGIAAASLVIANPAEARGGHGGHGGGHGGHGGGHYGGGHGGYYRGGGYGGYYGGGYYDGGYYGGPYYGDGFYDGGPYNYYGAPYGLTFGFGGHGWRGHGRHHYGHR